MYTTTELLHEGKHSRVYRAKHNQTQQSVILKVLRKKLASPSVRNKLYKDYEIGNKFTEITPVRYSLQTFDHHECIVMQDDGLQSLDKYLAKVLYTISMLIFQTKHTMLGMKVVIRFAIELAKCVAIVHSKGMQYILCIKNYSQDFHTRTLIPSTFCALLICPKSNC
jgi:serine/threonine protein kinase